MRQHGDPLIISEQGVSKPRRVQFGDDRYDERWLQRLLGDNPSVLPVDEIAPEFRPLVPIGTEIACAAGSIDNLFVSPAGALTIVETKLWRNPEARRQAVAQIVDYAQALASWTYEGLQDAAIASLPRAEQAEEWSLYQWATSACTGETAADRISEQEFVDTVSQNLSQGRFLLLIVGDGIRRDAEDMARFLQRTPQLHFTLALVELALYELAGDSLLIVPRTTARTENITRAIVQVEARSDVDSDKLSVYVNVETPPEQVPGGPSDRDFQERSREENTWWIHERLRQAAEEMGMSRSKTDIGYSLYARKLDGDQVPVLYARVNGVQLPLWRMWPHGVSKELCQEYVHAVQAVVPLSPAENEPAGSFPDGFDEDDVESLIEALARLVEQLSSEV